MLRLLLRLLLGLSALGLVSDAAPVSLSRSVNIDISSCPITFLGKQYSSVSLQFSSTAEPQVVFDGFKAYASLPVVSFSVFVHEVLDAAAVASYATAAEGQIPNLIPPVLCGFKLTFPLQSGQMDAYFLNYGLQAAVHYSGTGQPGDEFNVGHNGNVVDSLRLTRSKVMQLDQSVDVTGCFDNTTGTTYLPGDSETDPATCTRATCQPTGVMDPPESTCSSSEVCLGNNECGERTFCSIVGPSVVDFNGATGAVPDFYIYTILQSDYGLDVKGMFRKRRLTDMPFLEDVFINTLLGSIHMDTGGIVYVEDDVTSSDVTSSLSSTVTRHVGADISKDDSGVTVTYTNLTRITLFFDGTLLHVTQEVPTGSKAYDKGLCVNATADSKYAALSGCDVVTVDAAGGNIDCSAVQTRCSDLLATLSSAVDRSAFVTACADNLLCHYPDVDGLACHFLDAYARTSRLSVPREASGCAVPVCVDHYCSWHEFCAVKDSGDAACYCRSRDPDLQNYREMHQYGDVATCSGDSASLTIYTCFLEEAGIDHSELHLNDSSCTGSYDADGHLLTFGFNSSHPCGGTLQQHGDQVVFANRVQNSHNSIVAFKKQFSMDFSCAYTQPSTPSTASFRIHDGSVSLTYNTENFTFTLDMGLFTNAAFASSSTVTNSAELELNQLFVGLAANDIGADTLALVIDDCWTTTESTPTGANRYDLISNKCPSDQTVTVLSNGEDAFSYFKFSVLESADASTPDIYLHCQVSLCIVANGCVPTCS